LRYQWQTARDAFYATGLVLIGSLVTEGIYFRITRRRLQHRQTPAETPSHQGVSS